MNPYVIGLILFSVHFAQSRSIYPVKSNNSTKNSTKITNYFYDLEAIKNRPTNRTIHPIILGRRSLRQMNGKTIDRSELMSLFEAARWAPSRLNLQTWRFVYAERNSTHWLKFLDALKPGNHIWAKDAAVLMMVLSAKFQMYKDEKRKVPNPSFDTGAACMLLALEGTARGLVVHAMGGFDPDKAIQAIGLDQTQQEHYVIEVMIVVGRKKDRNKPTENVTQRHQVDMFVSEGVFQEKMPCSLFNVDDNNNKC